MGRCNLGVMYFFRPGGGEGSEKGRLLLCPGGGAAAAPGPVSAGGVLRVRRRRGQDVSRALALYREAAGAGYPDAQCALGCCTVWARGGAGPQGGSPPVPPGGGGGYPRAWHFLGLSYDQGTGVEQNAQEAFRCFLAAAQGDYTDALCQTGMCYYFGHGTEKDYDRAVSYFRRAAERGHVRAMTRLGVCYETGHGAQQDPQQAETLYRRSADLGDPEGQYCLAGLLRRRKDPHAHQEAALLLKRPAAAECPGPSICWGCATKPATGWRKKPKYAVYMYQQAALQGHPEAMLRLGICYETGSGVAQDPAVAANLYRQAAERGNGLALCRLGRLYERGTGVRRDLRQAADLYEKEQAGKRSRGRGRSGPGPEGMASPPAAAAEGNPLRRLLDRLKGKLKKQTTTACFFAALCHFTPRSRSSRRQRGQTLRPRKVRTSLVLSQKIQLGRYFRRTMELPST